MPFRRAEPGWSGMRAGCHWRTATQSEIPVSILTAVVGAPFFIYLLRRTGGISG